MFLVFKPKENTYRRPTLPGEIRTQLFQLLRSRLLHTSPSTSTCLFPSILINTADQCKIHLDHTNGKPRSRLSANQSQPRHRRSFNFQPRFRSVPSASSGKREFIPRSHFSSHAFKSNGFRTPSKSSRRPVEKLKLKLNKAKSLQRKPHSRPPGDRLISYKCL